MSSPASGGAARCFVATAPAPGAVALIQLHGGGVAAVLRGLTGTGAWTPGRVRLVRFGDFDEGLAVLLRDDTDGRPPGGGWAQLMPHGGPRVVQKLLDRLRELGAAYDADPPARGVYPEAESDLEADMLTALARAQSPAAVDLLLAQPALWREALGPESSGMAMPGRCAESTGASPETILTRSRVLDRLMDPATVAVVGRPNAGKSTLTNAMLGRAASLVADLPGTTRDWVAGLAELAGGVAVRWLDTPGLRRSDDPLEARAIELAAGVVAAAEVVVAMREPDGAWPEPADLPPRVDLWVANKVDTGHASGAGNGDTPEAPLEMSALTGHGLDALQARLLTKLGLDLGPRLELWAFSAVLREDVARGDVHALRRYTGV